MPRIVWAEDSDHDRMFIQALLGQMPARPRTEFVSDGEELLERIASAAPDLVVLDLQLPRVGGLEVLSLLHQRKGAPPVVVFSDSEGQPTIDACLRLGAARYIRKPADYREFREAVLAIARSAFPPGASAASPAAEPMPAPLTPLTPLAPLA